jgi:Phage tail protein (Tail_P2_I)
MSAPDLTPWGERLRERTEPLAPDDAAHGYVHALLAQALSEALERVAEIYDPEEGLPGGPLLDVDRCPAWALPWLAQLVGITLPVGVDEATARAIIRDVAGWKRGTVAALRAAAGFHLTGDKTVYFRERDPDSPDPPYTLEVVTLADETSDPDAVLAELLRQKPAGIVLKYRTVSGWDYQALTNVGPDPYSALDDAYPTYRELQEGPP